MKRLVVALVMLWAVRDARAGGCPTCTGPSDCPPGDFCVLHNRDVGCGSLRMLCCPGQACNTFSGRPSCEGTTCTVVGAAAADAALPDSATPAVDAAPGGGDGDESGCSCRTAAANTRAGWGFGLLGFALVVVLRRRR